MRQVLADRGRKRKARKRQAPPIEHLLIVLREDSRMVELSAALRKLEKIDPDGCKLIQMKYQHRVTWDELAQVTGRSIWQVRAECDYVLRWLRAELA